MRTVGVSHSVETTDNALHQLALDGHLHILIKINFKYLVEE